MGWKGALRSIQAEVRRQEREAQKRQREYAKQQKEFVRMHELEAAATSCCWNNWHSCLSASGLPPSRVKTSGLAPPSSIRASSAKPKDGFTTCRPTLAAVRRRRTALCPGGKPYLSRFPVVSLRATGCASTHTPPILVSHVAGPLNPPRRFCPRIGRLSQEIKRGETSF